MIVRMLLSMQRAADANSDKHLAVTVTRIEKDAEIAIDNVLEHQKIPLEEIVATIGIENRDDIDIATAVATVVATVTEDADDLLEKQIAVSARAGIGLAMKIQSVTVAPWLDVERVL